MLDWCSVTVTTITTVNTFQLQAAAKAAAAASNVASIALQAALSIGEHSNDSPAACDTQLVHNVLSNPLR